MKIGQKKLRILLALLIGVTPFFVAGSCSQGKKAPPQETVMPLLRQEADVLKREGEDLDPAFGVTATWEIEDVQVRQQPNNPDRPWAGTIRFSITSKVREPTGTTSAERFEKNFEFVWDLETERWIIP